MKIVACPWAQDWLFFWQGWLIWAKINTAHSKYIEKMYSGLARFWVSFLPCINTHYHVKVHMKTYPPWRRKHRKWQRLFFALLFQFGSFPLSLFSFSHQICVAKWYSKNYLVSMFFTCNNIIQNSWVWVWFKLTHVIRQY